MNRDSQSLLQRLSDAIDEHGAPTPDLLAEAATDAEALAFLEFWTGDIANSLASPLPPCGIGLRQDILRLPETTAAAARAAAAIIESPLPRSRTKPWISAAAAAAILIACGWMLYQPPHQVPAAAAPTYTITPGEIAAIQRDIDKGIAAAAAPLAAVRMSLASLDNAP